MPGTAVDIVGNETDGIWLYGIEDKQKCTALILDTDGFSEEGTIRYQNRIVPPICVCTCV